MNAVVLPQPVRKINLCSGSIALQGYINIDLRVGDVRLDLERDLLPFPESSVDVLVCTSAINYFDRGRAQEIIKDVFRILKPGAVCRFGTQDLQILAAKYLSRDTTFYFEKLSDGRDRFQGRTFADKLNAFFGGFPSNGKPCKYVHDFESLRGLFEEAGYSDIQEKAYCDSRIPGVEKIDNRPEQMFFLEASKPDRNPKVEVNTNAQVPAINCQAPESVQHNAALLTGKSLQRGSSQQVLSSQAEVSRHDQIGSNQDTKTSQLNTLIDRILMKAQQPDIHHIPDVSELPSSNELADSGFSLWTKGLQEQAWQCFLKTLDADPANKRVTLKCGEILTARARLESAAKLYSNYLDHDPSDPDVQLAVAELTHQPSLTALTLQQVEQRKRELDALTSGLLSVSSDQIHLEACMKWLSRAQRVTGDQGLSAFYDMIKRRWDVSYPETTGYIIPTFLNYARLAGDPAYVEKAAAMGRWEMAIQWPDGGVGEPVGIYGLRPRVFNTSQVILGWVALFQETGDAVYLTAAEKAADWIVKSQDPDGKWTRNTYAGPRTHKCRVAWSLLELHSITGNQGYRRAAQQAIAWTLEQAQNNGWFANTSLTDSHKPWTHLIGYTLVGLLEAYTHKEAQIDRKKVLETLRAAAQGIIRSQQERQRLGAGRDFYGLPGTYDPDWQSTDSWSCITGNAQLEYFLRKLSRAAGAPEFLEAADWLLDELKRLQLLQPGLGPDLYGGLPGSHPVGGGYCPYWIPNWGVKFFADSLLQRLLPVDQQRHLG